MISLTGRQVTQTLGAAPRGLCIYLSIYVSVYLCVYLSHYHCLAIYLYTNVDVEYSIEYTVYTIYLGLRGLYL